MPKLLENHPPNTNGNPAKIERNATIINDRLSGMTYREIAKKHHINYSHVGNILKDDKNNRATLQAGIQEAISFIPSVMDNYDKLLKDDELDSNAKLKTNESILKVVGILGKHTENPVINQYFQVNQFNTVDPGLTKAFGHCFGSLEDDTEVLDAEYDETQVNTETT